MKEKFGNQLVVKDTVFDDFGHQRVSPKDLLNRWIVPLESEIDFLTLAKNYFVVFNKK